MADNDDASIMSSEDNDLTQKMKNLTNQLSKEFTKSGVITASKNIMLKDIRDLTGGLIGENGESNVRRSSTEEKILDNGEENKEISLKACTEDHNKFQCEKCEVPEFEEEKGVPNTPNRENRVNRNPFRHLIYSEKVSEEVFQKYILQVYSGLVYARKSLKMPSEKFVKSKEVLIPQPNIGFTKGGNKKKTLLLDLDETLIHSCQPGEPSDFVLRVPYCLQFLQKLVNYFEIIIFTASSPNYANVIVNFIDPDGLYIAAILSRSHCCQTKNGFFIKDIRILKNRHLKNILLVDNLSHSFGFQIPNGVPILTWKHNKKDKELKYLSDLLIEASFYDDLRVWATEKLRLMELSEYSKDDLLEK